MTQELDKIEEALQDIIHTIDVQPENADTCYADLKQALKTLQQYRKDHISIKRDDVPEGLQRCFIPLDQGGAQGNLCLDYDALQAVKEAAALIVRSMEDDHPTQ